MIEKGVLPQSKMYFHTASDFALNDLFYLIYSGEFHCTTDYQVKRDHWNSYLFMRIRKGKLKVKYKKDYFTATADTLVFLNCNEPHLYAAEEHTIFDWFHFSGNASKGYFDVLFQKSGCVFLIENNVVIHENINRILKMAEINKIDEDLTSVFIHQILYELRQLSNNEMDHLHIRSLRNAVQYIEMNFQHQLKLEDIAEKASMSIYHFSRVFKKHMDHTPYQYLTNIRINNAKKLLHHTNLSIQEIAYQCGFNSASNFIQTFKKHTTTSPSAFKKLIF